MFLHRAYGLGISSPLNLPELESYSGPVDVNVRRGKIEIDRPADAAGTKETWASEKVAHLQFEKARFLVYEGREIVIDADDDCEATHRLLLTGPALAMLLHQRGYFVMHASAIRFGDCAVAFAADKGEGKSTLAAACAAKGHGLICDDVLAIRLVNGQPRVVPGFGQIKLWPDAAASVGAGQLPRLHPDFEKLAMRRHESFDTRGAILSRVVVLGEGAGPRLVPVGGHEAFIELVRHSYLSRLMGREAMTKHFEQLSQMLRQIAVRRLFRPRNLSMLGCGVTLVENDVQLAQTA